MHQEETEVIREKESYMIKMFALNYIGNEQNWKVNKRKHFLFLSSFPLFPTNQQSQSEITLLHWNIIAHFTYNWHALEQV